MITIKSCLGILLLVLVCQADEGSEEHGQFKGPKDTNCTCGWTNKARSRIVGGRETFMNEYPHMVGIIRIRKYARPKSQLFCGGSIITNRHIITAAHCTIDELTSMLKIVVGEHDITDDFETKFTKQYNIIKKIEHADYDPVTYRNDISILVVERDIEFNQAVGPACLPHKSIDLYKQIVKVTGWGTLEFKGPRSNTLMKVNLIVVSTVTCSMIYTNKDIRTENPLQFCTYGIKKDSCQGDSGGPVIWLDNETNRYTLVGLVSFGNGCAKEGFPGVNTDVYAYMPWIQRVIAETSETPVNTCAKVD